MTSAILNLINQLTKKTMKSKLSSFLLIIFILCGNLVFTSENIFFKIKAAFKNRSTEKKSDPTDWLKFTIKQHKNIGALIMGFLVTKDLVNVVISSKFYYELYDQEDKDFRKFGSSPDVPTVFGLNYFSVEQIFPEGHGKTPYLQVVMKTILTPVGPSFSPESLQYDMKFKFIFNLKFQYRIAEIHSFFSFTLYNREYIYILYKTGQLLIFKNEKGEGFVGLVKFKIVKDYFITGKTIEGIMSNIKDMWFFPDKGKVKVITKENYYDKTAGYVTTPENMKVREQYWIKHVDNKTEINFTTIERTS